MKIYSKDGCCDSVTICEHCANRLGVAGLLKNGWEQTTIASRRAPHNREVIVFHCFTCNADLPNSEWQQMGPIDTSCQAAFNQAMSETKFDAIAAKLKELLPHYHVHIGDNHIAVHAKEGWHRDASGADTNPRLLYLEAAPACIL